VAGWPAQLATLESGEPWFAPWRESGKRVAASVAAGLPLPETLNRHATGRLRFVPSEDLPPGVAYERHIFETGRCPTRDNLHDFFNGLVWLALPQAKRRLNQLQAAEIARAGVGGSRGPLRDAITVFDENGALLDAPPALWEALLARDWRRLFVDLRPLWLQARVLVVGHALLEKLLQPRKDITAHVWRSQCSVSSMAEVDCWLASQLTAERLARKPLTPLPLLGVPGWTSENQNFSFYDDSLVFRPAGRKESKTTGPVATSRT
jgi:hypothetical protein